MSRALVVLALRSGIPPDVWRRQTDDDIDMAIVLLREQDGPSDDSGAQMSG